MSTSKRSAQKTFAAGIIEDTAYRESLLTRARAGMLAPAVEVRLLDLYLGKPIDEIRVFVSEDDELEGLSDHDLLSEIRALELALANRIAERTPNAGTVQ
jgi:hypothetical protein